MHQDANGKISYVGKSEATEFITDNKGEILIKNLIVGTYVAYETKNPNYGYEMIEGLRRKSRNIFELKAGTLLIKQQNL